MLYYSNAVLQHSYSCVHPSTVGKVSFPLGAPCRALQGPAGPWGSTRRLMLFNHYPYRQMHGPIIYPTNGVELLLSVRII